MLARYGTSNARQIRPEQLRVDKLLCGSHDSYGGGNRDDPLGMSRNRERQRNLKLETGNWKIETGKWKRGSLLLHFLRRNRLSLMNRRRRDVRPIEPLKAKNLRGDVLEREISQF